MISIFHQNYLKRHIINQTKSIIRIRQAHCYFEGKISNIPSIYKTKFYLRIVIVTGNFFQFLLKCYKVIQCIYKRYEILIARSTMTFTNLFKEILEILINNFLMKSTFLKASRKILLSHSSLLLALILSQRNHKNKRWLDYIICNKISSCHIWKPFPLKTHMA